MAADAHHELIIIKRHGGGHGEGHHGGAWKIAFADFMTAMMALFLVLWLISATNPKQRIIIAHYFNPVKLAEVSVNKKGLDDPTPGEGGHGGPKSGDNTDRKPKPPPPPVLERRVQLEPTAVQATHDEATLFRDPYAMLSEIAAQTEAANTASNAAKSQALDAQASDTTDPFHDPFSTVPTIEPQQPAPDQSAAASTPPQPAAKTISDDTKASSVQAAVPPTVMPPAPPVENDKTLLPSKDIAKNTPRPTPADKAAADTHANDAEANQLRNEINAAMHMDVVSPGSPNIEVKSTAEGILVSLTDEGSYSMFAVGSAEPQSKTIEVMGKVAELLKSYKGLIVVRGHTDGRPYKSKNYDNWQLSAARAQMAHYMLVRGGLDEKRIDRIEGYADHQLKLTTDPLAAENRRIEILVRKDKP